MEVCSMHFFRRKWIPLGLSALVIFTSGLHAQSNNNNDNDVSENQGIRITTRPTGATVYLKGEYKLVGRAPYVIYQPLAGLYEIEATKLGYEKYTATHYFRPGTNERLSIKLTRKTRLRAMIRSMFLPGWGQYYSDQKFKGLLLGSIQLISAAYLLYSDTEYQKAVDRFNQSVETFRKFEKNAELRAALIQDILNAQQQVDRKYELRKRSLIVAASIYVYNLLDALILFPSYPKEPKGFGLKLAVEPGMSSSSMRLGIQAKF